MIGIDTNVLVRFLVDDDPRQNRLARRLLAERSESDPAFVCTVTLAETVWVLTRSLGYTAQQVIMILRELLATEGLVIEHAVELGVLLAEEYPMKTDIADHLIAWSCAASGARQTVTFDRCATNAVPGMELLE